MTLGASLSLETVNSIAAGPVITTIQKNGFELKEAPKLNNENTLIDFTKSAATIAALVRGLDPYPVAKALLNNQVETIVKIYKSRVIEKEHKMKPGSFVIEDNKIVVACGQNMLEIEEIQLPNKKRMKVKDLLNGYSFNQDARFGVA
jgi:methionyl-tRNA formyltransferase